MGALKQSSVLKEIPKNEPEEESRFGKANQARKLLNQPLLRSKSWAFELSVTERIVQMWADGSKEIPPARIGQILKVGNKLLSEQREAIDSEIQALLDLAYGGRDPGRF